MLIRAN